MTAMASPMHLASFVLAVSLAVTLSVGSSPDEKRQLTVENDCSFGQLKEELSEDERLDTTGTYLILDGITCNGTLVSWQSCFFYNTLTTISPTPAAVQRYRYSVRIYRRSNESFDFLSGSSTNLRSSANMNATYVCDERNANNPVPVLEGDLVGVRIESSCDGSVCPGHPNLNSSNGSEVFYDQGTSIMSYPASVVLNSSNHVPVSINVQALIIPDTQQSSETNKSADSISPSRIAGIASIAILVAALLLLILVFFCYVQKRHREKTVCRNTDASRGGESRVTAATEFDVSYTAYNDETDLQLRSQKDLGTGGEMSYRQRLLQRTYSNPNTYSLLLPVEADADITGDAAVENKVSKPTSEEPHYEFQGSLCDDQHPHDPTSYVNDAGGDAERDEDPYWEPASMEDELKMQLAQLRVVEIPRENIQLCECLGSGQFGIVSRGVWHVLVDGKGLGPDSERVELEVAVKMLPAETLEDERVKFLQEAAIMGQFHHPNVLSILGVITTEEPLGIVIEMMHKGDLRLHLQTLRPKLTDSVVDPELPAMLLSYCRQVAAGMGYLAGKSFIHRDLAARNILVSTNNVCKIADFGLSRLLQDEDFYTSSGGKVPVKWTAPEALTFRKYSTASDVWSYGVLLYEIWALGRKPYHQWTNSEALEKILRGYRLCPPPGCPRMVYELMLECWNPSPESRPSFFDVLLVLQRPDFQILRWSPKDKGTYSLGARTLGEGLESGRELYQEIQGLYSTQPNGTHSTF